MPIFHNKNNPRAKKIVLPKEASYRGLSVEQAIERRRSIRDFSGKSMTLSELSQLLYYACGITESRQALRATPSAGALYPVEVYPVINNVEGLTRGIYHYSVGDHSLEVVQESDFRQEMIDAALGQEVIGKANVAFVMTAIPQRARWRYRERTNRYIFLEASHIAQNFYLEATSMGLGACAIGAFSDDAFNRMLNIDGAEEATVYTMAVGHI